MMPIMLHINTLQLMYEMLPGSKEDRWWIAAMRITLMDQPVAFPEYKEAWLRVMSMLASQVAITTRDHNKQS
jgi:hypothetical protein